jgi:ketosteroid isomerase-like protein
MIVLLTVSCGGTANVEQEKTALLQRDAAWAASVKDGDAFLAFFAPGASWYPTGMPVVTGAGPLRQAYDQMMATPGTVLTWTATKADVAASGDIGYTAGSYEMSAAAMPAEKGKYITVWKKIDGQWKVMEDIGNADAGPPPSAHVMVAPSAMTWTDPPPSLPAGARLAVISGDPSKPGPFVIRAQLPAGYRIAPHWHPGDENVTVFSGTVALGMGETWDDAKLVNVPAGGYAGMPAEMRHYFLSRTASTIQVHGMGPLVVNYVNPADDPGRKK